MRTSEFREAVEELGFIIEFRYGDRFYVSLKERVVAKGFYTKMYSLETTWDDFSEMVYYKQRELFDKMVEYVATPISEREEEKRYRLKLINKMVDESVSYLNKIKKPEKYFVSSQVIFVQDIKSIFTESELKTMVLTGFEKVEVTE